MIVFDLRCAASHVFEAWFTSTAGYEDQRERRLIGCPVCGGTEVTKAAMAPAIAGTGDSGDAAAKAALAALAAAQASVLRDSQWVGTDFAHRARAMHAGDEPAVGIHGQVTLAEAKALVGEGVPVAPLPLPVVPPDARN